MSPHKENNPRPRGAVLSGLSQSLCNITPHSLKPCSHLFKVDIALDALVGVGLRGVDLAYVLVGLGLGCAKVEMSDSSTSN